MTLVLSWMDKPQENTLTTIYDSQEKGTYSFVDGNGNTYMFHGVEVVGLESCHLSEESFVGHNFKLAFSIAKELDSGPDETFGNHISTGLSLVY